MRNKTNSPILERNNQLNLEDALKRTGLSKNELGIYNYLLKNGRSKSGPIIRKIGIASSAFYEAISSLTQKGFVSYEVINNIKFYSPESPERHINQLKNDIDDLKNISTLLEKITSVQRDRNMINVYEGVYGFKRAFEQAISKLKPKDEILIISYSTIYKQKHDFRRFFTALDKTSKRQGAKSRVLIPKELLKLFQKEREEILDIYTIKTLPSKYFGPWAIDITPYEVLISIITADPIAISINHPVIIESFKKNFEYLWEGGKGV